MRPLALVALVAALAGCSLPYVEKTFAATPKNNRIAEGVERPVEDKEGEHAPNDPSGGHKGEEGSAKGPEFENTQPLARTAASFPKTAQPTGKPPVHAAREYVSSSAIRTEGEGE